ncbi:MAG: hypothetical protein JWR24_1366 [Actinoallomurus sp.]|nr:hypothetical protein [Actinoallomurus sp.]
MRTPSVAPAVTRAVAVALAVAAAAVLAFTALVDYHGAKRPAAAPTQPVTPVPASTLPGSIDLPTAEPTGRRVSASTAKAWLKALTGMWAQDPRNNYFQFRADGTGEWVAYGQKLWTGRATPRDAKTFDLSDPSGQGESYWQVKLISGGRKLLFAGTRQTYRKI